jgi:integrase
VRVSGSVYIRRRKGSKSGPQWYASGASTAGSSSGASAPCGGGRGRPPEGYYRDREARQVLEGILTDDRRGVLPESRRRKPSGGSYADACEAYLRYLAVERRRDPRGIREARSMMRRRLIPEFNDTPLENITLKQVNALRSKLLVEGRFKPGSIQKLMGVNYSVLKHAVRMEWIPTNPAEHYERVKLENSGDFNVLTPEEVFALARAAETEQEAALYIVAAFTGLREGELRVLRWTDVDFATATVHVRDNLPAHAPKVKRPKSKKVRAVPLIDRSAAVLDLLSQRADHTGPNDLVFPNEEGVALDDSQIRKGFYAALNRAGLGHKREDDPQIVFHDLRPPTAPSPSASGTFARCRATWATRTSRRRCATCTTSRSTPTPGRSTRSWRASSALPRTSLAPPRTLAGHR